MTKELVPFHVEHGGIVCERMQMPPLPLSSYAALAQQTATYTFVVDGVPLAFGGITMMFPGVAEGWSFISPDAWKHTKSLFRAVRGQIALLRLSHGLHRIQIAVKTGFPPGLRWAEHLGFEQEGVMRKFGTDGQDYIRLAKTF